MIDINFTFDQVDKSSCNLFCVNLFVVVKIGSVSVVSDHLSVLAKRDASFKAGFGGDLKGSVNKG
jgi:hypothetical protein